MSIDRLIVTLLYYALVAMVLANVIVSWIPSSQWHPLGRLVQKITDPLLKPFRRLLPPINFTSVSIDFSPALALIALFIAYYVARSILKF